MYKYRHSCIIALRCFFWDSVALAWLHTVFLKNAEGGACLQLFSEASEVIVGRGAEQRGRHLCSFLCHPSRTFTPRDLQPLSTTRMRFSLADFFFFFGMRIGTFFFQGTRHFKKKSWQLPSAPTTHREEPLCNALYSSTPTVLWSTVRSQQGGLQAF